MMIQKTEIKGVHVKVDKDLQKYAEKKLGGLDKYLSSRAAAGAHLEVTFKEEKPKKGELQHHCDAVLHLPGDTLTVKETGPNLLAAVDITEAKMKILLKKYKAKYEPMRLHRRILRRLHRRGE